jgi:hypothetical protein
MKGSNERINRMLTQRQLVKLIPCHNSTLAIRLATGQVQPDAKDSNNRNLFNESRVEEIREIVHSTTQHSTIIA